MAQSPSGFEPIGTAAVTNVDGEYCIESLPAGIDVIVEPAGPNCFEFTTVFATTAMDAGTCADGTNCVGVGPIQCFDKGQ